MRTRPALRAAAYLAAGLRTAVPALAGSVLLPLLLLAPFLPFTERRIRALADAERRRAARILGAPIPRPYPPEHGRPRPVWTLATWRDMCWMTVHGWVGLLLPLLFIPLWLSIPFTATVPAWWRLVPPGKTIYVIVPVRSWPGALAQTGLYLAIAVPLLIWLTPWLARFEGWYAKTLLSPSRRTGLAARVQTLTTTRADALEAHGAELRRIERDLHDGTQAQIVTAALRLGLAESRFAGAPEEARKLMLQARSGLEDALTGLRAVIRGIYPPILSDRGLAGAVRALAANRAIPVAVDIPDPDRRYPAAVEAAAYYVVAEALSNIAKHSGAAHGSISLRRTGTLLRVVVHDDGRGGADPAAGTGLAGIRRRVAALDGVTRIDSPADGTGTTLEVELPCGS